MYMGLARIVRRKDGRTHRQCQKLLHPPLTWGVKSIGQGGTRQRIFSEPYPRTQSEVLHSLSSEYSNSDYTFTYYLSIQCLTEAGQWHLDLKNGSGAAGQGAPEKADVTMTMEPNDFNQMFAGKLG